MRPVKLFSVFDFLIVFDSFQVPLIGDLVFLFFSLNVFLAGGVGVLGLDGL